MSRIPSPPRRPRKPRSAGAPEGLPGYWQIEDFEALQGGKRPPARELPDVTALLVFVLSAFGLFIVPLAVTLMQNDAVAAVVALVQ